MCAGVGTDCHGGRLMVVLESLESLECVDGDSGVVSSDFDLFFFCSGSYSFSVMIVLHFDADSSLLISFVRSFRLMRSLLNALRIITSSERCNSIVTFSIFRLDLFKRAVCTTRLRTNNWIITMFLYRRHNKFYFFTAARGCVKSCTKYMVKGVCNYMRV